VFATLVSLMFAVPQLEFEPLDHFEAFAGDFEEGRRAIPFDVRIDPQSMDLLSPQGFANALHAVCCLKPGSAALAAPVCSTFVFMSRGSTHRSKTNPLGRKDSKACVDGNILTARTLILLTLAAAKCCFWVLEQPMTSVMEYHPLFQKALRMLNMRRMSISMSHYGAPHTKATVLRPGHECIDDLRDHEEEPNLERRQMVVHYVNSRGEKRVHGGTDLKSSQSYPPGFGRALARVRTKHLKRNFRKAMIFLRGGQED
ncbi:unnamed protein product, partial [Durusdinium trenchii]